MTKNTTVDSAVLRNAMQEVLASIPFWPDLSMSVRLKLGCTLPAGPGGVQYSAVVNLVNVSVSEAGGAPACRGWKCTVQCCGQSCQCQCV